MIDRLATIGMGRKVRGSYSPFHGGAGSPSNTAWLGPMPNSLLSDILIHPALWSQQTGAENWGCAPFMWGAGSPSNTMSPV